MAFVQMAKTLFCIKIFCWFLIFSTTVNAAALDSTASFPSHSADADKPQVSAPDGCQQKGDEWIASFPPYCKTNSLKKKEQACIESNGQWAWNGLIFQYDCFWGKLEKKMLDACTAKGGKFIKPAANFIAGYCSTPYDDKRRKACLSSNGEWNLFQIKGEYGAACVHTYADASKSCEQDSDCQSNVCAAYPRYTKENEIFGACSDKNDLYDCIPRYYKGKKIGLGCDKIPNWPEHVNVEEIQKVACAKNQGEWRNNACVTEIFQKIMDACTDKGGDVFWNGLTYKLDCFFPAHEKKQREECIAKGGKYSTFGGTKKGGSNWKYCRMVDESKRKEKCLAEGGKWGPHGMAGIPACTRTFKDASKPCQKNDDCLSKKCLQDSSAKEHGKCFGTDEVFGCFSFYEKNANGTRTSICFD